MARFGKDIWSSSGVVRRNVTVYRSLNEGVKYSLYFTPLVAVTRKERIVIACIGQMDGGFRSIKWLK